MGNDINILVVDDEEDMCWALENILKVDGYNVVTTTSGSEAIKKARENTFNIAFVDVKMPDFDGMELARLIKEEDSHIGTIMISGYYYEDDSNIQKGLNEGVYLAFVGKPFDNVEIRKITRRALERSKR